MTGNAQLSLPNAAVPWFPGLLACGQEFLVAASYWDTTLAGMRPRSPIVMPWSLAHARIPPPRCRPAAVRAGPRCARRALRACSMNGASCRRNAVAFLALRSIRAAVEIVFQRDSDLLRHTILHAWDRISHRRSDISLYKTSHLARRQPHRQPALIAAMSVSRDR